MSDMPEIKLHQTMITEFMEYADNVTAAPKEVKKILEAFCNWIIDEVKDGNTVILPSFAKFELILLGERTFSNPNDKTKSTTKGARHAMRASIMAGVKKAFEQLPVTTEAVEDVEASEDTTEVTDEPKKGKAVKAKKGKAVKTVKADVPAVPAMSEDETVDTSVPIKKVKAVKPKTVKAVKGKGKGKDEELTEEAYDTEEAKNAMSDS
jgi:nucleoid DNA-binding protein